MTSATHAPPHVSVVTRTQNRPAMLSRALASVAAQTMTDLAWVVVNDAGDPAPVEAILAQAPSWMRVHAVHRQASTGMEAASNHGIRESASALVVILDDDDTWDPSFLLRTTTFLEAQDAFAGVVTHSVLVEEHVGPDGSILETGRRPWIPAAGLPPRGSVQIADMARINQFATNSFVYRRAAWEELGGYDESLPVLGDWEFNLRFLEKHDIGVIAEGLSFYHHRVAAKAACGSYGNSVIAGIDRHLAYDGMIRNRFMRRDLERGAAGLGHLLAAGRLEQGNRELALPALAFVDRVRSAARRARDAAFPWKGRRVSP